MSLKTVAGVALIIVGAVLGGVALTILDRGLVLRLVWIVGGIFVVAGVPMVTGKPLPSWGPQHYCYTGGAAIIVCSLFPLGKALRDEDFRCVGLMTFAGALVLGVAFLFAGRRIARGRRRVS